MKPTSSKNRNIFGTFITLIFGVALFMTAFTYIETVIVTPTEAHRQVSDRITELNQKAYTSSNSAQVFDSPEYKAIKNSDEGKYMQQASIILFIVHVILYIGMIGFVYNYVRRKQLANKPVGGSLGIIMFGWLLSLPPTLIILPQITSTVFPPVDVLATVFIGFPFVTFITSLLLLAFRAQYNRKHSFAID